MVSNILIFELGTLCYTRNGHCLNMVSNVLMLELVCVALRFALRYYSMYLLKFVQCMW